jgi:hypothetical protein
MRRLKAGGSQNWLPHKVAEAAELRIVQLCQRTKGEKGRQMDLQMYYQKIREAEAKIADEFPLMVSVETPDGGKCGTRTEVPRRLAAKLLVEGQARVASKDEARAHREALAEAQRSAERTAAAARLQLTVLSTTELDRLRSVARSTKE